MVVEADIYEAGTPHPEINKWSCLPLFECDIMQYYITDSDAESLLFVLLRL